VSTIVMASLYERLAALPFPDVDLDTLVGAQPSIEELRERVEATHGI